MLFRKRVPSRRSAARGHDHRLERHPRTLTGGSPDPFGDDRHSGLGAGDYSSPAPMLLNVAISVNAGRFGRNPNFVTGSVPGLATRRGIATALGRYRGS